MINWEQEQRQAPIGLVLFFAETIQKLIKGIWPLILIYFFKDKTDGRNEFYFYMVVAASVFVIVNTVFSYLFFKFQIVDGELIVKKGYLKKVRINIPLERIQTINTKQNILQRMLNLVSVEVDTAGAKDTEIEFIAIRKDVAGELEKLFRAYRESHAEEMASENEQEGYREEKTILSLNLRDLVRVGISENHLKSFFIILSVFYGLYYQVKDVFEEQVQAFTEESMSYVENLTWGVYVGLVVFVFILSVLFSFGRIIFKYYNLNLLKIEDSLKIQHGLLNTKELNIPISKIQTISFHRNPIRNLLKFSTLKIKQAVSGEAIKKKQSISVPSCTFEHAGQVTDSVLETSTLGFSEKQKTHVVYFIIQFFWFSVVFTGISFLLRDYYWTWLVLLVLETFLASYLLMASKKRYIQLSDTNLLLSKGAIAQTEQLISMYKIQSVSIKQNFFQKRRNLVSIVLYSASGDGLRIPYISEKGAVEFRNYILYKIETSQKTWM